MKRKREAWDFGESQDLYNTEHQILDKCLVSRDQVQLVPVSTSTSAIPIPDLIQRKRLFYSLNRDKRVNGNVIRRDIQLFLPDFLREKLWQRHGYSLEDVSAALRACPKEYIWQLALYYNVQILNSASRPSSCFIIRGGKRSAIERTRKEFVKMGLWKQDASSVLLKTSSCHKDPMYLPYHFVTRKTFDLLVHLLPEEEYRQSKWLGQAVRCYESHVKWQHESEEVHLVPLGVYWRVLPQYDFILLNRVLPYDAYCTTYCQNTSATPLSEWTDIVKIAGNRFALLEEAFYVVCER